MVVINSIKIRQNKIKVAWNNIFDFIYKLYHNLVNK